MCSPDCNSVCLGGIGSEIKSPPGLFLHTSYIFQLPGTASSTAGPTSAPFTQVLCAVLVTHRSPPGLELSLQDNPAPHRPMTYLVRLGVPCAPGTRASQSFSCTTELYTWAPQHSPCGCRQSLHQDVPFSCLKYAFRAMLRCPGQPRGFGKCNALQGAFFWSSRWRIAGYPGPCRTAPDACVQATKSPPCSIPNPLSSQYISICFNFHLFHSPVLADSISGDCTVVLETQPTIMCPNLELVLPLPSRNSQKRQMCPYRKLYVRGAVKIEKKKGSSHSGRKQPFLGV